MNYHILTLLASTANINVKNRICFLKRLAVHTFTMYTEMTKLIEIEF